MAQDPQPQAEGTSPAEGAAKAVSRWLSAALDELDYGIVVLCEGARVAHVNHAARLELDAAHPLHLVGPELRARSSRDAAPFEAAVAAAASNGLRRLLTLGEPGTGTSVSVVPLDAGDTARRAVLIVLAKRAVGEALSIQGFARAHALTSAETRVLVALCNGTPPLEAADRFGVAISTVRSQIGSIRSKTGAQSIRALVRQIAVLPPVKGVLRREAATA